MRPDHGDAPRSPRPPLATLRAVSGRWLLDAAPDSRISINGVAVGGARIIIAGDVITIAGVAAARRRSHAGHAGAAPIRARRHRHAATRGRQRADAGAARPKTSPSTWATCPRSTASRGRAAARTARSYWNYAAWVMGALLVLVLGLFMLLEPIALDLQARRRARQSRRQVLVAVRLQRVRVPGRAHAAARAREGYVPAEVTRDGGRARSRRSALHPPRQTTRQARGRYRRRRRARSPPMARRSARCPAPSTCRPAIARSPSRRRVTSITSNALDIAGGGERQQLKVALKPSFGVVSISSVPAGAHDRSRRQSRRRHAGEGRDGCGHPARAGVRAGAARLDLERRRDRGRRAVHRSDRARRGRCARHGALGAVGRAGDDGRQLPRRHARHDRPVARRIARHQRHARGLRAVDPRGVRRAGKGIARSMRGSRRCSSKCASRASRPTRRCS